MAASPDVQYPETTKELYLRVIKFTKELEDFMTENGFSREEAHTRLEHWYIEPSSIIFHETKEYWYYSMITSKYCVSYPDEYYEFLSHHFHSHCQYNKFNIIDSTVVGCFGCNKIYPSKEVINYVEGNSENPTCGSNDTAICPYCTRTRVVGNYIFCLNAGGRNRSEEWFKQNIEHAYKFWTIEAKYKLV